MQSSVHVSVPSGQMWELLATIVVSLFVVLENSVVVVVVVFLGDIVVVFLGDSVVVVLENTVRFKKNQTVITFTFFQLTVNG